jgi:tetratricopeptide (TPR) repeat protein
VLGKNPDPVHVDMAAKVLVNLGHVAVWKQSLEEATLAYAQAMRLNPSLVDMHQVHGALGGERFLTAVEAAAAEAKEPNVAALTWWVGWARLDQKQYEKADEAFSAAVAQDPKFINTWYFLAVARHAKQDMEGAIGAFHRYADEDAPDLAVMLLKDPDTSVRVIDGLVGWCAEKQRNADAAFLSELECGIYPNESRYWNNAGLFWRDGGEAMQKSADPDAKKKSREMFEKSWAAYGRRSSSSPTTGAPERRRGDPPLLPRPRPREGEGDVQEGLRAREGRAREAGPHEGAARALRDRAARLDEQPGEAREGREDGQGLVDLPLRIVGSKLEEPAISVDGAWGQPGLNLSHWPGNATPASLRHDLSTGIALALRAAPADERARLAAGCRSIANNHFDTDGCCAMFAVRRPEPRSSASSGCSRRPPPGTSSRRRATTRSGSTR